MTILSAAFPAQRARAQSELAGTAFTIAYVVTAGGTVVRLLEGPATLAPGAQIRMTRAPALDAPGARASRERIQGTLIATDSDSVAVRVESGEIRRVARSEIERLQLYRGVEPKWAQGFAMGFAIGAVVGAGGGFLSGDDPQDEFLAFSAPEKAVILGIAGAVTGSTLGAVIGLFNHGAHWQRARFGAAPIAGPAPGGGMRFGGAVRF
jgi:hypothetical protein